MARKSTASAQPVAADVEQLRRHATEAADLLKVLANANRLQILCALAGGEMSVGALNEHVDLSQSGLSQQLALLRERGIVVNRREAQTIYYRLAPSNALRVIELLRDLYCSAPPRRKS